MNLASFLKKNHLVYKLGRKIRILLFLLKDVLTFSKNRISKSNKQSGTILPSFGYIRIRLNELVDFEKKLLFDRADELNWLHSIKMLLNKESNVVFYYPEGSLIFIFLAKNIGCNIAIVLKKKNDSFVKTIQANNLENIDILYDDIKLKDIDLVFTSCKEIINKNNFKKIIFLDNNINSNNFNKQYFLYKNINGRYFAKNQEVDLDLSIDFTLLTRKELYPSNIILSKDSHKISGGTYLRSPEIYPFDLCYDSVLDHVDEFIFAVDSVLQIDTEYEHVKRNNLIEKFMDKLTESQRKKVKIVEFDFKARFNKKLDVPAKWLVDVSNHILDMAKYNNICFIQADEMYHEDNFEEIKSFAGQEKTIALQHEFLHFVHDLEHIRNPKTVAYTHATRVFKKDKFSCTGDGYTFIPLEGKDYLPKTEISKYPIYHIGYVVDFRKKVRLHLDDGGIFDFKDKEVSMDDWIENADLIDYHGGYPKSLFLKDRLSSKKISPFLKNISSEKVKPLIKQIRNNDAK